MKKIVLAFFTIAILLAVSCKKEYFERDRISSNAYSPTIALPLAELDITVSDLLKKYSNEINLVHDPAVNLPSGDSAFYLELVFTDTLPPLSLDTFTAAGGVGLVSSAIQLPLPVEKVDLRIFGSLDGHENNFFRLTDPSVRFTFDNTTDFPFELTFRDAAQEELYTENTETGEKRFLEITQGLNPQTIPENSSSTLVLTNNNVENYGAGTGALTEVFEPTPKFLYYGVTLQAKEDGVNTGGQVQVYADVVLPLEGYGNIIYHDTAAYDLTDSTIGGVVDFAELRLIVDNGLPLEAKISVTAYDTTSGSWIPVLDLPLFENGKADEDGIVVQGAVPASTYPYRPAERVVETTDLRIEGEDLDQLLKGQKLIITANFYTTGYEDESIVKMYGDYYLKLNLGLRTKFSPSINDLIGSGED